MAGEVFRFEGEISGHTYGSSCMHEAEDYETAYMLNALYDLVKQQKWADTEKIEVVVRYPKVVERSETY